VLDMLTRGSSGAVDGGPQVVSEDCEEVSYPWEKNGLDRIALSTSEESPRMIAVAVPRFHPMSFKEQRNLQCLT
jgi:hypothetical protein